VVKSPALTVIVTGLPRSGTSLVMQMLAAGGVPPLTDGRRAADDDNPRGYYELEAVKALATDPEPLRSAAGHAVKVIHRLVAHLPQGPDYAFICLSRSLKEVLASQQRMLLRLGRQGASVNNDRLADIFRAELARARAHIAAMPNARALDLEHRELIEQPPVCAEKIAAFLRTPPSWPGPLDAGAMAAAVDPALYRSRE